MTEEECGLILALTIVPGGPPPLSAEEFLRRFRKFISNQEMVRVLLDEALVSRDADEVECALIVGFRFGFSQSNLPTLTKLAAEKWHHSHENIVSALDQLNSPEALDVLYEMTQWVPEYLEFDEARALATKAIWAIGKIAGEKADAMLIELARSKEPTISEAARNQLQMRRDAAEN
jgi:hypothetical protein